MSGRLMREKAEAVVSTGAAVVASGNPGCTMQLLAGLREIGAAVDVVHPIELLDAAVPELNDPTSSPVSTRTNLDWLPAGEPGPSSEKVRAPTRLLSMPSVGQRRAASSRSGAAGASSPSGSRRDRRRGRRRSICPSGWRSSLIERGVRTFVADAQALPFGASRFDLVIANAVMYHIPNLDLALTEVGRVLVADGVFVATTFELGRFSELWDLVGERRRRFRSTRTPPEQTFVAISRR